MRSATIDSTSWKGRQAPFVVVGGADHGMHELGHKTSPLERWLAKISLLPTVYGHFFVEHNCGHHVRVATPEVPASARFGESFWSFLPRTMIGSLTSVWSENAWRVAAIRCGAGATTFCKPPRLQRCCSAD
ncbi:hypothetical protein RM530_04540 [Algiphilus sp. W345]|uniref:Alkane 1-monooxygenase n=1 Tax=Banduia mediterranea TaxID=3075609 RepID=A0ABU2WHA1_9GAMM|nr:hypothetical protein [Algiphilus sp. W345]MDT0496629.1 hypothetical protein [Algiphilus sp. W345]